MTMPKRSLLTDLIKNHNPLSNENNRPEKWGLVLSGGGTKGAYEIGAWRAIRELRIPIRGIAGTSIGALNAALFLGCDLKKIENIYRNIQLSDVIPVSSKIDPNKNVFDRANLLAITKEYLAQRGLTNAPLRGMLEKHLNVDRVYESPLDLGIVTFDVSRREPLQIFKEDIEKDKLIDYLLASANFPIFKTQNLNGKRFVDGGLYDNVPFNLLIERGYTHLIVIDINGIGMTRKVEHADKIYLKVVTCSEALGGTFEFNKERISRNMTLGYLDTLKAFHKLFGSYYFFRRPAFNDLLLNFDLDTIWGLETAARLYNIDRLCIYKAEDFLYALGTRHLEMEQKYAQTVKSGRFSGELLEFRKAVSSGFGIPALVSYFTEQPVSRNGAFSKAYPDLSDAAKAIIALKNHQKR